MNIDWSKAPEGTNAYCSGYWLKRLEGPECEFQMQPVNNGWEPVNFKPWKQSGFTYRKDDIKHQQEERAINLMSEELDVPRAIAERAFSMGYRKFEIVEEDV